MLRITHCLDNRLIHDGENVSLTRSPDLFFSAFGTRLCYRVSKPQGLVWLEVLGKLKTFIDLIESQTRDLPTFSIVPQPTTLVR
jgi:hypothetical protein